MATQRKDLLELIEQASLRADEVSENEASSLTAIFTKDEKRILRILSKSDSALSAGEVRNQYLGLMLNSVLPEEYKSSKLNTFAKNWDDRFEDLNHSKGQIRSILNKKSVYKDWSDIEKDKEDLLRNISSKIPIHRTIKKYLDNLAEQGFVISRKQKAGQSSYVYSVNPKLDALNRRYGVFEERSKKSDHNSSSEIKSSLWNVAQTGTMADNKDVFREAVEKEKKKFESKFKKNMEDEVPTHPYKIYRNIIENSDLTDEERVALDELKDDFSNKWEELRRRRTN